MRITYFSGLGFGFFRFSSGASLMDRARCRAIIIHAWNRPSLCLSVSLPASAAAAAAQAPPKRAQRLTASLPLSPSLFPSYGSYMKYSSQPFIIFVILTLISEMLKGAPVRLITYISPSQCNIYANDAACDEMKSCRSRLLRDL